MGSKRGGVSRTGRPNSHAGTVNSCSVLESARWWRAQGCTGLHNGCRGRRWTVQQTSARGSGSKSDAGRRGRRARRQGRGRGRGRAAQRAGQVRAGQAGHSRARCGCGRVVDAGGATVPGARQIRGAGQGSRSESSPPESDSTIDGYGQSTAAAAAAGAAAIATPTAAVTATHRRRRVGLCWGWSAAGVEQRHRELVWADWRWRAGGFSCAAAASIRLGEPQNLSAKATVG